MPPVSIPTPLTAVLRPVLDRRLRQRQTVRLDACLDASGQLIPCVIADVSAGGAQLLVDLPPFVERARLEIEAFGAFECRITWHTDTRAGIEFLHEPDEVTARLAALLRGS